ncbi:MAG: terminase gpA endonuclease subunit, partial [Akkermansiaceae bacterium]
PSEGVVDWSCKNVFLGEKETPTPQFYDIRKTPWNRRLMECAEDPAVKKCTMMKSSRSGATEACLNVLRWMPGHRPGPALYSINSEKKAREVAERRLITHFKELAADYLTGNPDDISKLLIKLANMEVTVSGSGSASAFMEGWYWCIVLDELEEHSQEHGETTTDRAEGRQTTVDDPILYQLSKPQLEGGPIDVEYRRGTQEKFHVPCARCGERQELTQDFLSFRHCKKKNGEWDLDRVLKDTYYQCRHCEGRMDDWEKYEINQSGIYVPEPDSERKGVKAEPGHVSLHISDLYVPHPQTTWGMLASKFLSAFVINPSEGKKKFYWTNHLAKTWELRKAQMRMGDLERLKGGVRIEEDGKVRILGYKFRWCFDEDGERVEKLPTVPSFLTICADKQGDCLKWVVFAWGKKWNSWVVDYGTCYDESYLIEMLDERVYVDKKGCEHKLVGGLIDSRYKPKTVFRACVASNGRFSPSMGHGETDLFAGKLLKVRDDVIDGNPIRIYDYHNHTLESDFYLGKVKRMSEPRMWLPDNMGEKFGRELCSAKLVVKGKREKWDKDADVPNDWGDACKMQFLLREIILIEQGDVIEG